ANIILPTSTNGRSIYYTPAKEFQVSKIDATNSTVALQPLSIVLLLEGSANLNIIENSNVALEVPIKEATILFIPGDISQRKIQISIKANKPSEIFEAATTL
ncbi:MAG: hypothetical protein H3C43_11530, partial [Leptonema sp. (in: Bacteria)]|nr:hypothetical protein [Leptonema sp. (in: bacteria)]